MKQSPGKPVLKLVAVFLLLSVLFYFPIFLHLDSLPLHIWDEARRALSAIDMLENGNLLVVHYEGRPEHSNSKPPFLIWMIAICYKLFGVSELSVRLPSAIATFLLCWSFVYYSKRLFDSYFAGILAALVLISSQGFMGWHVARNGDTDALLCLFSFHFIMGFLIYVYEEKGEWIWFSALALLLAFLTKGVAAFLALPMLGIILLIRLPQLLKSLQTWLPITLVFVMVAGYYFLREQIDPGYLTAVGKLEWKGRVLEDLANWRHPWYFYIQNLVQSRFSFGLILLLISGVLIWRSRQTLIRKYYVDILSIGFFILIVISIIQSKASWYDAPVIMLFSFLTGTLVKLIPEQFRLYQNNWLSHVMLILSLCSIPYYVQVKKNYENEQAKWDERFFSMAAYLKELNEGEDLQVPDAVVVSRYAPSVKFYRRQLQAKGIMIDRLYPQEVKAGSTIMCNDEVILSQLYSQFEVVKLHEEDGNVLMELKPRV